MKKTILLALCALLVLSCCAPAFAEAIQSRAVIGADLNSEQVSSVYKTFGVQRGRVVELRVTNAEERRYLAGYIDSKIIGTRSISCVYVELLPPRSGISVVTNNISWCTSQMYVSALATAGITDARIVVTAPFRVSGTAALTGVYKAYEDMTGSRLADSVKLASTRELAITGGLAQDIGDMGSVSIVNELKLMLNDIKDMSDEELRGAITDIAGRYQVRLTDTQVQQLVDLCRTLQQLDPSQLRQRVEQVQDTLSRMSEAKSKLEGFLDTLRRFMESVSGFFDTVGDLFR